MVWAVAQLDRRPTSTQGARRWLMPRGTRGCAWRVSRTPDCSPATAPTSTTSPPRDAPRLLRAQSLRPGPDPRHRHRRGARGTRRAGGVHRRRSQPLRQGAVALVDRASRSRDAPPAAGRGRGALRRRPGGPRGRRLAVPRRGRSRARRRRLRSRSRRGRLPRRARRHRSGPRAPRLQPDRRARRSPGGGARRAVRVGAAHDRAPRSRSRRTSRCRWRAAASSSTTPRAPASSRSTPRRSRRTRSGVLLPSARHPRAPRPRRDPRHRWRLRPEDHRAARRDVPHARRPHVLGGR